MRQWGWVKTCIPSLGGMNINLPAIWVFARAAGFLFLSDASGRTQRMKHHKSSNSAENLELEDWSNFEGWSNIGLI